MNKEEERINAAAGYVQELLDKAGMKPKTGIILGSGLGNLATEIQDPLVIPYRDIPDFPVSTAVGHKGNFVAGTLSGKTVIAMQGRIHYYEGYTMKEVTLPVRVMKKLGVEYLLIGSATGGINFEYKIGDLMIVRDHINMMPNPLLGPNLDSFGVRFPDMTHPYDTQLRDMAKQIAFENGIKVHEGVYVANTGPSYETPAEWHFFRMVGADAAGMSTVPEVIVARHCGIRVFAMCVITNAAGSVFDENYKNDENDVVEAADAASHRMQTIFRGLIQRLPQ